MQDFKQRLQELALKFSQEIKGLRTGRPTASLIEDIIVDAYGQPQPLKHLASIALRPPQSLAVEPWDQGIISNIETALKNTPLSLSVMREGKMLRISTPPLSQEQRESLVKVLGQKREEIRVVARRLRDDVLKALRADFQSKKIGEDEHFRQKETIDKEMHAFEEKLSELFKQKEREILTI